MNITINNSIFNLLYNEISIAAINRTLEDYMAYVKVQCNARENKYGLINTKNDLYKNLEESTILVDKSNMSIENYRDFYKKEF